MIITGLSAPLLVLRQKLLNILRRLVNLELCKIQISSGEPYDWPDVEGYITRGVDVHTFNNSLHKDLSGSPYAWMFERGDTCVANFYQKVIVGFGFSTKHSTRVSDRVEFVFPGIYVYSFSDYTHPDHRGKRLARERWKVSRRNRIADGSDPQTIYYRNLANLQSLRANLSVPGQAPNIPLGYSAYCDIGGRSFCWKSPAAHTAGAFFRLKPI